MSQSRRALGIMATLAVAFTWTGIALADDAPSVEEQVAGLQKMCADTAEARAQRQAEKPLYFRLGEYDQIEEFVAEVVRLHFENPALTNIMDGIDGAKLTKNVTDFVSTGTGGPKVYTGRDMKTAHARFNMTDADFMAAGGDIVQAMKSMGYGQEETEEFLCILVSMKDLVVVQ